MKTILFTNVRDEHHILEWAIHHLNLGFTRIHIFDHLSIKPVKEIIKENIPNITIERLESKFANKSGLIIQSCKYSIKNGYDWMLYLDGDEFLVLREDENVESFLKKYENYQQVGINWLMFGSNHHEKLPYPNSTMIETYIKCNSLIDQHTKAFVRPNSVIGCGHPHIYKVKNPNLSVASTYDKLESPFYINPKGMEIDKFNSYIAHFYYQSYDTYIKRKMSRERDDIPNAKWPKTSREEFHSIFNDIENIELKEKYNQKNIDTIKVFYNSNSNTKENEIEMKEYQEDEKENTITPINNLNNLNINKNTLRLMSKLGNHLSKKACAKRF